MNILVTGGAGYIGSHTLLALLSSGHESVVVDSLYNSNEEAIRRCEKLSGKKIPFFHVDIRDEKALRKVFSKYSFDAVIHFAGLKAVGESVLKPWEYYDNNINGTLTLIKVMKEFGVKNIIFSSSATVYGDPVEIPISESCPLGECTNPYGRTKRMIEDILKDEYRADVENKVEKKWNIVLLRYFNPIGADESGVIGEDPKGRPNNLMPVITSVATGRMKEVVLFGNDYDTPDGTGVRDYIHVSDLASGHVAALKKIEDNSGLSIYNLGTGIGYSAKEVVETFERVNGVKIPHRYGPRRPGDIATCYANADKAYKELGWKATKNLEDMCRDSWNWIKNNPSGYIND